MSLTIEQKTVIHIFSRIANNDYKQISSSTNFILDNLPEVLGIAQKMGLKEGVISKFVKKDPEATQKVETRISEMDTMEFTDIASFYARIVGKNSAVFNQKNDLVKLNDFIYSIEDQGVKLYGATGPANVEKVVTLLDRIKAKDIEPGSAATFVKNMFKLATFHETFSNNELESFKNAKAIYMHPEFIALSKITLKKDKYAGKDINESILDGINNITHYCLLNIYPKGQFGLVKPNEQIEFLDTMAEIVNAHGLNFPKKGITPAIKYKKLSKEYSQDNNTELVTEEKYKKVQENLDEFIKAVQKPLQVLKKDGTTEPFDIKKVQTALEWASKPKMK